MNLFGIFAILCVVIGLLVCVCFHFCCKQENTEEGIRVRKYSGYRVAVSNRLFKGSFLRSNRELPCLNCKFIEMGEMACYEETCPQCGRVPSCRKKEVDKYNESLEILRNERKEEMELKKQRQNNLPLENRVPYESTPLTTSKRNVEFLEPVVLETST